MIRDEDGALTGYIYIDLSNADYGGFVGKANKLLHEGSLCHPITRSSGRESTNSKCGEDQRSDCRV
jgi:hypothetical protein